MSKKSKISALFFVLLIAGCASPQPPQSSADAPDKQSDSVVYDY